MFNVSQLYSIPQSFRKLIIMNKHLLAWRRKKRGPWFFHHVSCMILEKQTSSTKNWPMACCRCYKAKFHHFAYISSTKSWPKHLAKNHLFTLQCGKENFIFMFSYCIWKFHIYTKNTHLQKDAVLLHFRL